MSRLETQRISRASAEQRQGRAGRTAAGVCYRVWSALGLDALPWTRDARDLAARIELVRDLGPPETRDWPAFDDAALLGALDGWLSPWLDGVSRPEHLARLPLIDALSARLGWERLRRLDQLAPARLAVPSGWSIRIDYRRENAPLVAVRLQEVFGLDASPRIAAGRVPITFELLSPAQRPVQVTKDLASSGEALTGTCARSADSAYKRPLCLQRNPSCRVENRADGQIEASILAEPVRLLGVRARESAL